MRTLSPTLAVAAILLATGLAPVRAEDQAELAKHGHSLALIVCGYCHVAAPDQDTVPLRRPPGPKFTDIAKRKEYTAQRLRSFLESTHRGMDRPQGMPNPQLADYQYDELAAYFDQLRQAP